MRYTSRFSAALVAALLLVASPAFSQTFGICQLLGLGSCGGGSCGSCGCGSEPTCGCPSSCGMSGRPYAGQVWVGGGCNGCVSNDACCTSCLGLNSCGPSCGDGCGAGCGCGSSCAEPSCGCSSNCGGGGGCCIGRCLRDTLFGCNGCSGELYWCEWANDPPRCCQPCDCNGNWVGPSVGYRAPYAHPYSIESGGLYGGGCCASNSSMGTSLGANTNANTYALSRPLTGPITGSTPAYAAQAPKQLPNGLPTAKRAVASQTRRPNTAPSIATPAQVARRPVTTTTNRTLQR